MGGGGDQEIGESTPWLSSLAHHGGNNESVTAYGGTVERDGFEPRIRLPASGPAVWPPQSASLARSGPAASSAAVMAEIAIVDLAVRQSPKDRASRSPPTYREGQKSHRHVLASIDRSRSSRKRRWSMRTSALARLATSSRAMNVRRPDRIGRSSATGSPLRVTTKVSPAVTASHHLRVLVAKFALRDRPGHRPTVASMSYRPLRSGPARVIGACASAQPASPAAS